MKNTIPLPKMNKPLSTQQLNQKLHKLQSEYKHYQQQGNEQAAYQKLLAAYQLVPAHFAVLADLAYLELRLGLYQKAYQHYLKAIQHSPASAKVNLYDGMTEVCHYLGLEAERKKYGALAIELKKQQVIHAPQLDIPQQRPQFNSAQPEQNIIAFSLFGGDPRYCETALLNVDYAKQVYPAWTCRYYVNQSVPIEIQQRLQAKGAQVVQVTPQQQQYSGLMWRFAVIDDPEVKFFLLRDADSLISYREAAAVDAWLNSDQWFHCMRDSFSHSELLLAGMWGGCVGVFAHIQQQIQDYVTTDHYLSARVIDQHFLRYCLWPTISQSLMSHDSQAYDVKAVDFPVYQDKMPYENKPSFHVGSNYSAACIAIPMQQQAATQVSWQLLDQNKDVVCAYTTRVLANQMIQINLPEHYAENIELGHWKISLQAD